MRKLLGHCHTGRCKNGKHVSECCPKCTYAVEEQGLHLSSVSTLKPLPLFYETAVIDLLSCIYIISLIPLNGLKKSLKMEWELWAELLNGLPFSLCF